MSRNGLSALFFAVALTGCITHTATFADADRLAENVSVNPGQATVYVLRDSGRVQAMYPFAVALDKDEKGSIRRERYLAFAAAPGEHAVVISCPISCAMPAHTIQFTARAGKSYYFVFQSDMGINSLIGGGLQITTQTGIAQIDGEQAAKLMKYYAPGKNAD